MQINKVIIKEDVIEAILDFSRDTYPKEFIMLLSGEQKHNILFIDGLIFQTYQASDRSTSIKVDLPPFSRVVGSVHSHPSGSNKPSHADLRFFDKNGFFHMIICKPFKFENLKGYDKQGRILGFDVE